MNVIFCMWQKLSKNGIHEHRSVSVVDSCVFYTNSSQTVVRGAGGLCGGFSWALREPSVMMNFNYMQFLNNNFRWICFNYIIHFKLLLVKCIYQTTPLMLSRIATRAGYTQRAGRPGDWNSEQRESCVCSDNYARDLRGECYNITPVSLCILSRVFPV
jgi:hypothetical protein